MALECAHRLPPAYPESARHAVDFIVVAYRHRSEVAVLIEQLEETVDVPYSLTVVDNTLLNRGWSAACNLGYAATAGSEAHYVGFLNTDVTLSRGWLDAVLDAFATDEALAVAGPRCIDGLPWPREIEGLDGWVCGAAMIVRRDVFDLLGPFDAEHFPHEYGETDFERTVEAAGYRVRTIEAVEILHSWAPATSEQAQAMNAVGRVNEQAKWGIG